MPELAQMNCVTCDSESTPVTDEELSELRLQVPEWDVVEVDGVRRLRREFEFDDFTSALWFTDEVGAEADGEGHHPELATAWGRTTVVWWTYAIRGLHQNDFVMAAKTDRIYMSVG